MSEYAYQITADSGCDLSLDKCREIDVLPYKMPFTMDGKPMVDGMTEESFREFYRLMRAGGVLAMVAVAAVAYFAVMFACGWRLSDLRPGRGDD